MQVRRDAILATVFADLSVKNFFLFFVSRAFRDCGGVGGVGSRVGWGRGVAIGGDDDWCAARCGASGLTMF